MTIEELVSASHREFESIRNEMANRDELKATQSTILKAIEGLGLQLSRYDARWGAEFDRLSDRVDDIGSRVHGLEQRCGP